MPNGAWNVDEAEHAVHALGEYDLEYVEQPCATVPEARGSAQAGQVHGHPGRRRRERAQVLRPARPSPAPVRPDLLVIKAQPLGGITHALQIVTAAGLPVVVSSALDTAIGLSQGAALAAALPTLDYDCGLGTASLFLDDVADLRPSTARSRWVG